VGRGGRGESSGERRGRRRPFFVFGTKSDGREETKTFDDDLVGSDEDVALGFGGLMGGRFEAFEFWSGGKAKDEKMSLSSRTARRKSRRESGN